MASPPPVTELRRSDCHASRDGTFVTLTHAARPRLPPASKASGSMYLLPNFGIFSAFYDDLPRTGISSYSLMELIGVEQLSGTCSEDKGLAG